LGRAIAKAKTAPRHIDCDRGGQFDVPAFREWCRRKGIHGPRYGAIEHPLPFSAGTSAKSSHYAFLFISTIAPLRGSLSDRLGCQDPLDQDRAKSPVLIFSWNEQYRLPEKLSYGVDFAA
jgi:hypothetical protein